MCKDDTDKFMITFALKKLNLIQGKVVIYVDDIIQAYRIKFFFNRFHMKAFVASPEMAKGQISSIVHFFQIGQYDILIALNSGYSTPLPQLREVSFVLYFDMPPNYKAYKEVGGQVEYENGAVILLTNPEQEKKSKVLGSIQKKMEKAYSR